MISKGCKSIFPIQHQEIWDRYKQHVQAFWTPEEVSLQDDLRDLKTLNEGEKHFIKHVLAFFANSEGIFSRTIAKQPASSKIFASEINFSASSSSFVLSSCGSSTQISLRASASKNALATSVTIMTLSFTTLIPSQVAASLTIHLRASRGGVAANRSSLLSILISIATRLAMVGRTFFDDAFPFFEATRLGGVCGVTAAGSSG